MSEDRLHQLLGFQVSRAQVAVRALIDHALQAAGLADVLTPGMGPLLYHLFEHNGCTISDIVQRVGLDKTTVTNLLKAMQGKGLVHRRRSRADRRRIRILLTDEGRALEEPCRQLLIRVESRLREACGDGHADLARRLQRLTAALHDDTVP